MKETDMMNRIQRLAALLTLLVFLLPGTVLAEDGGTVKARLVLDLYRLVKK